MSDVPCILTTMMNYYILYFDNESAVDIYQNVENLDCTFRLKQTFSDFLFIDRNIIHISIVEQTQQ